MTKSPRATIRQSADRPSGVIAIGLSGGKEGRLRTFSRLILLLPFSHPLCYGDCIFHLITHCPTPSHTHSPASIPPLSICVCLCPALAMSASGSGAPSGASGSASSMKKAFPHVDLQGNDLPPSPAPSSPHAGRRYNIATELVFTEGNDQYNASSVPIYQVREQCHHRTKG